MVASADGMSLCRYLSERHPMSASVGLSGPDFGPRDSVVMLMTGRTRVASYREAVRES